MQYAVLIKATRIGLLHNLLISLQYEISWQISIQLRWLRESKDLEMDKWVIVQKRVVLVLNICSNMEKSKKKTMILFT